MTGTVVVERYATGTAKRTPSCRRQTGSHSWHPGRLIEPCFRHPALSRGSWRSSLLSYRKPFLLPHSCVTACFSTCLDVSYRSPLTLFQQTRIWLTTEEMRALYDGIAEISGDPAVGLRLGSEERLENYSPISIAALFTRSFRDALNRVARYKRLISPQELSLQSNSCGCRPRSKSPPFGLIAASRGQ